MNGGDDETRTRDLCRDSCPKPRFLFSCLVDWDSWSERISPFHREASLAYLRRICRSNAGKLRSHVVDNVEIAVGTIVVAKTKIGAGRLRVGGVHLKDTGEGQKASEGIVRLQAGQHNREIPIGQRQSEAVPRG